jgi:transcriptional regulator with XRE-family HTH domain
VDDVDERFGHGAGPLIQHFGRRLRRLRGERSQKEVAEGLGIPTTTLSSLEQQETVPRGPVLQRLSDYFGVARDYFYPPHRRTTSGAREWLRELRQTSFDVDPTIATHSDVHFDEKTKERFAENVRRRLEPKN